MEGNRIQEDLRHDFEKLSMLMTALRDTLAFDSQKAAVYPAVFQMLFGGAERVWISTPFRFDTTLADTVAWRSVFLCPLTLPYSIKSIPESSGLPDWPTHRR